MSRFFNVGAQPQQQFPQQQQQRGGNDFMGILALLLQQQQASREQSIQQQQLATQQQLAQAQIENQNQVRQAQLIAPFERTLSSRRDKALSIVDKSAGKAVRNEFDRPLIKGFNSARRSFKSLRESATAREKLEALADGSSLSKFVSDLPTDDSPNSIGMVNGAVAEFNRLIENESDDTVRNALQNYRDRVSDARGDLIQGDPQSSENLIFSLDDKRSELLEELRSGEQQRINDQFISSQSALLSASDQKSAAQILEQSSRFNPRRDFSDRIRQRRGTFFASGRIDSPVTPQDQATAATGISSPVDEADLNAARLGQSPAQREALARQQEVGFLNLSPGEGIDALTGGTRGAIGQGLNQDFTIKDFLFPAPLAGAVGKFVRGPQQQQVDMNPLAQDVAGGLLQGMQGPALQQMIEQERQRQEMAQLRSLPGIGG